MKRRFFRKTFLLYFVVMLVSVVFIEYYITRVVRSIYIENRTSSLSAQAGLIAGSIPIQGSANLDGFCRRVKDGTGARVTVILASGKVLGDSNNPSEKMDNHADRPEIKEAAVSGTGSSIRFSKTTGEDLLYVAKKIVNDRSAQGFIRLAVPLSQITASVNQLRLKINSVVILIFLFSGSLFVWQTNRVRKLVLRVSEYAGALTHGLFKTRLHIQETGVFRELADNLNEMASRMGESLRKKDEEANRLNVVLKSIPDALLLITIDGQVALSNTVARKLFGMPSLEGRPFIEVVRSPKFLSLVDKVKQSKMPDSGEIDIDFPEERHLSVRVSPLSYTVGELSGVVAIFHDMTHVKKLEEMRKDFVANVSHEIKTPVTAIKGFAETLLDGALYDTENAEKFLATIKAHSERLNRLVDDLLTISSIELGASKIQVSDVVISDVIQNVIQMMLVKAAEKDLELKSSVSTGSAVIRADKDRLEQIFLNLVDNAIKFSESGEIEVGVSLEDGRDYFYVRDTGVGVPEKYIERLGERFFRVDPSRSRELGGTGLGLAIVKHLVKAHRWKMKIESTPGKGTTVKIYY